ncbi:hypothetical protein VN97_g2678 [Penicillium thymicola]|uniref:Uncharacterized protein n=1 Tax=Penicillium thymicola TaxID=293382 RepID=A0AAI9TNT0_PENTH|nr:hypothetical protein VN97_g2678 [Penicillium thymicola]
MQRDSRIKTSLPYIHRILGRARWLSLIRFSALPLFAHGVTKLSTTPEYYIIIISMAPALRMTRSIKEKLPIFFFL